MPTIRVHDTSVLQLYISKKIDPTFTLESYAFEPDHMRYVVRCHNQTYSYFAKFITVKALDDFLTLKENNMEYKIVTDVANGPITRSQVEALVAEAGRAAEALQAIERKYGTDDGYESGDAFYADIKFNACETIYHYLFIKGAGYWYSAAVSWYTFKRGTFDELTHWLENLNGIVVKMGMLKKCRPFIKNGEAI
jgi:hypothetical protein